MATLQISDESALRIHQTAERLGLSDEGLVMEAVLHMEEQRSIEPEFTDAQIARFKESVAQLDRGEVVTSEQIDARFEAFFQRQASR
ncbi:hypothetical protein SAMN05421770_106240 [Granulicella rosea]|uniref:Uncharacterized protein n=1 Tax=Granulicella rosea TaxID=474952 RepID=A0A239LAN0_9BACT|nr:hypothetical protein [Granulicella rosea]SNT27340.1 hypothetical protein SAMN05421770_106240 [Granulicella rosea]